MINFVVRFTLLQMIILSARYTLLRFDLNLFLRFTLFLCFYSCNGFTRLLRFILYAMVHSYCCVHHLLWYTYLLLFHIVLSGSLSLYVLSPVMVHSVSVIVPRILVHSVFSDEFRFSRFTYRVWLFDVPGSLHAIDLFICKVHLCCL